MFLHLTTSCPCIWKWRDFSHVLGVFRKKIMKRKEVEYNMPLISRDALKAVIREMLENRFPKGVLNVEDPEER